MKNTELTGSSSSSNISHTSSVTPHMGASSTTCIYNDFFSVPELIHHSITKDEITFVYKRISTVSLGYFPTPPQIFKVVYSRHDGSEKQIFGTYIPASPEGYEFD